MANPDRPYRKLQGRGSGVVSFVTLWEGDTHLLQVTSWPSGEGYRRFFYGDIQAIIIRRTSVRLWINIVLGVLALGAAALLASEVGNQKGPRFSPDGTAIFWLIVMGVCVFFMVLNSLFGPTCAMHIQTAIQCEKLPTVRRERAARKVLAKLQPRVIAAQSAATAGAVSAENPVSP